MLSSVILSKRAIHVNILIMKTFVHLRKMYYSNKELSGKLNDLEKKYDKQFKIVFDALRQLISSPDPPKRKLGL